tara:strand:- start:973 stop:1245 length:273 start_codon:yes stop_codon:yes gene_type:complete
MQEFEYRNEIKKLLSEVKALRLEDLLLLKLFITADVNKIGMITDSEFFFNINNKKTYLESDIANFNVLFFGEKNYINIFDFCDIIKKIKY